MSCVSHIYVLELLFSKRSQMHKLWLTPFQDLAMRWTLIARLSLEPAFLRTVRCRNQNLTVARKRFQLSRSPCLKSRFQMSPSPHHSRKSSQLSPRRQSNLSLALRPCLRQCLNQPSLAILFPMMTLRPSQSPRMPLTLHPWINPAHRWLVMFAACNMQDVICPGLLV